MLVSMYNSISLFDFKSFSKMVFNCALLVFSVVLFAVNSAAIMTFLVAFVYYASFAVLIVGGFVFLARLPKLLEKVV